MAGGADGVHSCPSYADKPDEDCEDPQDVEALRRARDTVGDLKLKSAQDYDVPKHLRMNPEAKGEQLRRLEEKVEAQHACSPAQPRRDL